MRVFAVVGGPAPCHTEVFFRRLAEVGGPPAGWQLDPHVGGDGRALHGVEVDDEAASLAHLVQFGAGYERGPITDVVRRSGEQRPPDWRRGRE